MYFQTVRTPLPPPRPPPLYKGGMKFFKNGYNGGWEIITSNEGEARNGGQELILKWGDGKFLKSLYRVGRGVLTPLFYEDPVILPIPPFPNVVHPSQIPCLL